MQPIPDRGVVAAIRAVDRDLSVEWIDPPGRFAIFHRLQIPGRPDEVVDRTAAELQQTAALYGYLLDRSECALAAAQALRDAQLVCYVAEEDGSYRPLDHRVVEKLQRMDFYRRNLGLRDWTALVKAKADVAREARLREQGDIWDVVRRDRILGQVLSDILWGVKPFRSVYVRRDDETVEAFGRTETAVGSQLSQATQNGSGMGGGKESGGAPIVSSAHGRESRVPGEDSRTTAGVPSAAA